MSDATVKPLAEALFRIGAIRFGSFTLSSGRQSSYYVDLRLVPSHPRVYNLVLACYTSLLRRIGDAEFDVIAGVATAGVTISSPLADRLQKPMLYVRADEKGHGLGKRVEGLAEPSSRVLIIDDVVTSGGSVSTAAAALEQAGYKAKDCAVLIDRLEGGDANLRAVGVRLNSFTNIRELAQELYTSKLLSKRGADAISLQTGSAESVLKEGTTSS